MKMSGKKEKKLCEAIGYEFKNKKLLHTALTHSTFVNENDLHHSQCNERLEFLGDAILDAAITDYLYKNNLNCEEGELTKKRASIVCEGALFLCGKKMNLGEYLILGKGEENNGGRERPSMIADAVEAVIGAVYLDGGWEEAKEFTLRMAALVLADAVKGEINRDYKSLIQEKYQAEGEVDISYKIEKETGPDHNKMFYVNLLINGKTLGNGQGKSKKEAEQKAAKMAYEKKGGE